MMGFNFINEGEWVANQEIKAASSKRVCEEAIVIDDKGWYCGVGQILVK